MLAALASIIAWIVGFAAEKQELHYDFQANTYRHRRVLSFFYMGCQIIRKKINLSFDIGEIQREAWDLIGMGYIVLKKVTILKPAGGSKISGRRTSKAAGGILVALATEFWGLGCPRIYNEVATLLIQSHLASAYVLNISSMPFHHETFFEILEDSLDNQLIADCLLYPSSPCSSTANCTLNYVTTR